MYLVLADNRLYGIYKRICDAERRRVEVDSLPVAWLRTPRVLDTDTPGILNEREQGILNTILNRITVKYGKRIV